MLAGARLVDLTQPLGPRTVLWPGTRPVTATTLGDHERDGAYWRDVDLAEHAGTHLDAPVHFGVGRATVDELPLERLVVPAVRLDVRTLVGDDAEFTLTRAQVEAIEADEGGTPAGAAVLVCTGWGANAPDRSARGRSRESGRMSPSSSSSAASSASASTRSGSTPRTRPASRRTA